MADNLVMADGRPKPHTRHAPGKTPGPFPRLSLQTPSVLPRSSVARLQALTRSVSSSGRGFALPHQCPREVRAGTEQSLQTDAAADLLYGFLS